MDASAVWRPFVSWGTLVSGLATVLFWGFEWTWTVGVVMVLLLYLHEVGHVLAAKWRRVPVRSSPFFIPGLGAFVTMDTGRSSYWDEVLIFLGGPVLGGLAALLAKLVGFALHSPEIAFAGDLLLLLNLFNMAPFAPLDGGRILLRTGWVAVVTAILVSVLAVVWLPDTVTLLFAGLGIFFAIRARGQERALAVREQVKIAAVYLATLVGLGVAYGWSGPVRPVPSSPPAWLPDSGVLLWIVVGMMAVTYVAVNWAWQPGRNAYLRYFVALVLGAPYYLLQFPLYIVLLGEACGHLLGGPGLRRLQARMERMLALGDRRGVEILALGYDLLARQGRKQAAQAWLDDMTPVVKDAGDLALAQGYVVLKKYGYSGVAHAWLPAAVGPNPLPSDAHFALANNLAWCLFQVGRFAEAHAPARLAVEQQPQRADCLDTLGQVLLALGRAQEAEGYLRTALQQQPRATGMRVALARALAAQGRTAEAVTQGEEALARHKGAWPADEPAREQVIIWAQQWRQAAGMAATVQP